jgi:GTP diphosphokinase / guanosine-3',5'-bis(diphosphate) 3'-diphosphatase
MKDPDEPPPEEDRHLAILERILERVRTYNPTPDLTLILKAYELARVVHGTQRRRKNNEAYIVHPLAVALACAEHRMDDVSVAAALLHDCIEDAAASYNLTEEVLAAQFGTEVAAIVDGLTKLERHEVSPFSDPKLETLRKILTSSANDLRALIIKIFDRLDNIGSIEVFPRPKQEAIAFETQKFYIPLATRLGFYKQARLMEDSVMRVLQPEAYETIKAWLDGPGRLVAAELEARAAEIQDALRNGHIESRYRVYHKGLYTILKTVGADHLTADRLSGACTFNLCILVDDVDACFRALNVVHRKMRHLREGIRDFINNRKVNGYQSLHSICTAPGVARAQVIVRTFEMDLASHIGVVSQLREEHSSDTSWRDELLATLQGEGADEVLELTSEISWAEIEVLTPDGQVRKVERGATALDYAYSLDRSLGDRAVSAVIDGEPRPLKTVLRSGQSVDIVTGETARPSYQRLDWVRTSRARFAVRKAIRLAERAAFQAAVDAFLAYCNKRLGFDVKSGSPRTVRLLERLGLRSELDLGRELQTGRLHYDWVLAHMVEDLEAAELENLLQALLEEHMATAAQLAAARDAEGDAAELNLARSALLASLLGDALGDVSVDIEELRHPLPMRLADCCRPEYGDDIVALTSKDRGAVIHRRNCREVHLLLENKSPRVLPAAWRKEPRKESVHLSISGRDRRGLLYAIAEALLQMKIDAQSIVLAARPEGTAEGEIWLELNELMTAGDVIARLGAIPGVVAVATTATDTEQPATGPGPHLP